METFPRTRSFAEEQDVVPTACTCDYWNNAPNAQFTDNALTSTLDLSDGKGRHTALDVVTHDSVTAHFHENIAKGKIISNPYDSISTRISSYPVKNSNCWWQAIAISNIDLNYRASLKGDVSLRFMEDSYFDPNRSPSSEETTWPTVNTENLKSLAIARAWSKIDEADTLIWVSAAEAHKSWATLARAMKAAVRLAKKWKMLGQPALYLKPNRRKGLTRLAMRSANTWLELRYGFRPLYHDVISAIESINKIGLKPRTTYRSSVKDGGVNVGTSTRRVDLGTGSMPNFEVYARNSKTKNVDVSVGVLVEHSKPKINAFQSFGAGDLLQSEWELIPYSFLIDWFVNISDLIAAWAPKGGVTPLTSWCVVREDLTDQWDVESLSSWHGLSHETDANYYRSANWEYASGGYVKATSSSTIRTIDDDIPTIPALNVRLDVMKYVDMLALSGSSLRRTMRSLRV